MKCDNACFGCGEVNLPGCLFGLCAKGSAFYEAYDDPEGQAVLDAAFSPVGHIYRAAIAEPAGGEAADE